MTSMNISSKRRLPAWMVTISNQNKKTHKPTDSEGQISDTDMSKKIVAKEGKFQFTTVKEKQVISDGGIIENHDGELPKVSPEDSFLVMKKSNDTTSSLSAAQIIAQSMPVLTFKGRIVYSCHYSDCSCICEDILDSLKDSGIIHIGFDMEWPVSFHKGSSVKTALIQMCLSDSVCYLFHISAMFKFPELLRKLICDERCVLVGLNIESDLWKLERDYDFRVKPIIDRGSVIDVGKLANEKLKSSEQWALDGLCKNVLRLRLNKDLELRCGDWNEVPLNDEQKLYAATDAFAGLLVYQCLKARS